MADIEEIINSELEANVNDDNINDVLQYVKLFFSIDANIYYKKENGNYIFYRDDEELFAFSTTNTISDVVNTLQGSIDYSTPIIAEDDSVAEPSTQSTPIQNSYTSAPSYSKIQLNLGVAYEISRIYDDAVVKLEEYQSYINRHYLTEPLSIFYIGLRDNSAELIYTLSYYVTSLSETINICIELYLMKDESDYHELESICNELWGALDEQYRTYKTAAYAVNSYESSVDEGFNPLENLTGEDYLEIMGDSDSFFDGLYSESVEEFQTNIQLAYQSFLANNATKLYNAMIESVGLKFGLTVEETKSEFAEIYNFHNIYNDAFINENIPSYLWDAAETDYDRALLCMAFDDSIIGIDYQNTTLGSFKQMVNEEGNSFLETLSYLPNKSGTSLERQYEIIADTCYPIMQSMQAIKNLCTHDYTGMNIEDAYEYCENIYNAVGTYLGMYQGDGINHEDASVLNKEIVDELLKNKGPTADLGTICDTHYSGRHRVQANAAAMWKAWKKQFENNPELESSFITWYNDTYNCHYTSYSNILENDNAFLTSPWITAEFSRNDRDGYYWPMEGSVDTTLRFYVGEEGNTIDWNYNARTRSLDFTSIPTDDNFVLGINDIRNYELYKVTFNDEFLTYYAQHNGTDALRNVMVGYFRNLDYNGYNESSAEHHADVSLENAPIASINLEGWYSQITNTVQGFAADKVRIDATRRNLEMTAAENLIVDDVSESDLATVRSLYYNSSNQVDYYVVDDYETGEGHVARGTEWDILSEQEQKALAKIYKLNPEYSQDLIDGGFHNLIVDSKGHARAINTANDIKDGRIVGIDLDAVGSYILSGGVGLRDGLIDSVKGVARFVYADGKMDENDYYSRYILEELQDRPELSTIYGTFNSVGNMTIPMVLSAFVPVYGQAASLLWTGASIAGNEAEHLMWEGVDRSSAYQIGTLKGLLSIGSQKLLGGLTGMGDVSDKPLKIFNKLFEGEGQVGIGKKLLRFLATTFSNQVHETGEELFENVGGYVIDAVYGRELPTFNEFIQENWQTAYMTFLSTPLINAMGRTFQGVGKNVPQKVKFDNGLYATYSMSEYSRFIGEDGNFDQESFFKFLAENNRFSDMYFGDTSILNVGALESMEMRQDALSEARTQMENDLCIARMKNLGAEVINTDEEGNYTVRTKYGVEILIQHDTDISNIETIITDANIQFYRGLIDNSCGHVAIEGIDYEIEISTGGDILIEWKNYDIYRQFYSSHLLTDADLSDSQRNSVHSYIRESNELSYKTMNGLLRNSLLVYNAQGEVIAVRLYPIYGSVEEIPIAEYEARYGSIEDVVSSSKDAVLELDNLIRNNRITNPVRTFRGLNSLEKFEDVFGFNPSGMSEEEISRRIMAEGSFTTEGFFSTSATRSAAPVSGSQVLYVLDNDIGTPMLDLSNIGGISGEQEVLVAEGVKYKYTSVEVTPDGRIIIHCKTDPSYDFDQSCIDFENKINKQYDDMIYHINLKPGMDYRSSREYVSAPSFSTVDDMRLYISSNYASMRFEEICAVVSKHFDESSSSGLSNAMYYEFLNASDLGIPHSEYVKVMETVINQNQELRESILEGAKTEVEKVYLQRYEITDAAVIKQVLDDILGESFIESGVGENSNWEHFYVSISPLIQDVISKQIKAGKEPVIWSGFSEEQLQLMDQKYITISNTTVGGFDFLEAVYSNWNGSSSKYHAQDLWAGLSTVYAQQLCDYEDASGNPLSSIKFLYPSTVTSTQDMFGELFKMRELPEIVSYGTIDTIVLARTDPNTMEVIGQVEIDITDLNDYYDQHASFSDANADYALAGELSRMFMEKVEEALK